MNGELEIGTVHFTVLEVEDNRIGRVHVKLETTQPKETNGKGRMNGLINNRNGGPPSQR